MKWSDKSNGKAAPNFIKTTKIGHRNYYICSHDSGFIWIAARERPDLDTKNHSGVQEFIFKSGKFDTEEEALKNAETFIKNEPAFIIPVGFYPNILQ